jgi:hypothetical protein
MLKKIIGISLALVITLCAAGGSTYAYLLDTEDARSNFVSAGTLDMTLDGANGTAYTITASNIKPGNYIPRPTTDPATDSAAVILISNDGSVDAGSQQYSNSLVMAATYSDASVSGYSGGVSDDNMAGALEVTYLAVNDPLWGEYSILGNITDANSNGYPDINDLYLAAAAIPGEWYPITPYYFKIQLRLNPSAAAAFQGKGLDITLHFTMNQ